MLRAELHGSGPEWQVSAGGRRLQHPIRGVPDAAVCVETTARMAGNLGYGVTVVLDATRTFDLAGPDGSVLTADELTRATAVNLHGGGFARVVTTAQVLVMDQVPSASSASPA